MTKPRTRKVLAGAALMVLIVGLLLSGFNLSAQQTESSSTDTAATTRSAQGTLPDNPAPQPPATTAQQGAPKQTKRILGIIPNFRSVTTDVKLPPQTVKEKFMSATEDSFDYSSPVVPILLAGYNMGINATPEFHQGAAGYGRYLWHSAVDQTTENYFTEFVVPAITREDSRYYTLGHGGFVKRTGYSLSRAFITRNDAGKDGFNISEVLGAGMSAGLANAYYPAQERNFTNTGTNWGLDVAIDSATFVLREFWPEMNRRLFHGD